MNRLLILMATLMAFGGSMSAQKYKFGSVTKTELSQTKDPKFPEANAVVLYRNVVSSLGSYVEVHERIKIFNEEGYEHATIRIPLPDVKKLKGATFNLVDGAIVETKLDKDLVFTDEKIKGIKYKTFTFPNVSPGSILEFTYQSEAGTTENIYLQYDIPIRDEKVTVTNKTEIGMEVLQNPRAFLKLTRVEEGKSIRFMVKDVPALEDEDYIDDMDIYRSYVRMNIISAYGRIKLGNWDRLAGLIVGFDEFGQGVKPKKFYRDDVENLLGDEIDQLKKAKLIYAHVREKVQWNEEYAFYPSQSIRETYKEGEGDLADINILMISMLRSAGIDADPVLISTKRNGIPLTASWSAFNSVLASVTIGDAHYLLDAAHELSGFDYVATHFINWQGQRIHPNDTYDWLQLSNSGISVKNVMGTAVIDEDLRISGNVRERHAGHFGLGLNSELVDLGDNQLEDLLPYQETGLELEEVETASKNRSQVDVQFEFEMDNQIDEIGDKLYFSPLIFLNMNKNPFDKEVRNHPIEFGYPFKYQYMISYTLPEGYAIESMPEAARLVLPDNMGTYSYRISGSGSKLQVVSSFQMNKATLGYDQYELMKEFFQARMAKEDEKVVLAKP